MQFLVDFLPLILETKHSRFPVIGESKDDVIGILLAKELLNYYAKPEGFVLREEVSTFKYRGGRDLSDYEDGTEKQAAAAVGQGESRRAANMSNVVIATHVTASNELG